MRLLCVLGKRVDLARVYSMEAGGGVGEEVGSDEGLLN